jgi:hypothetical protein
MSNSSQDPLSPNILNFFFWLSTAVFLTYALLATFVLVPLRFKLDKVSIFSMTAVFISFLIRFTNWLVHKLQGFDELAKSSTWFLAVDNFATTIFLMNAYFFSFEMKIVHGQIISKSHEEFIGKERRTKKVRDAFMILALVIHIIFIAILIFKY